MKYRKRGQTFGDVTIIGIGDNDRWGAPQYHYSGAPHYAVPALADTEMVLYLTLGTYNAVGTLVVWDEIWRDDVNDCPLILI